MSNRVPHAIGNHGPTLLRKHASYGVGAMNVPVQMGWLAMTGKAGQVGYVQYSSLCNSDVNLGLYFQSEVGVTVDYTLCNPGLACSPDPNIQAEVMWTNTQTVPAEEMVLASFSIFTVIRITFTADGTIYLGAR